MRRRYRVLGNVAFYLALFVAAWKIARAYICHGAVLLALTGCASTYRRPPPVPRVVDVTVDAEPALVSLDGDPMDGLTWLDQSDPPTLHTVKVNARLIGARLDAVVLHELGHVLLGASHSPDPTCAMFTTAPVLYPCDAEVEAARKTTTVYRVRVLRDDPWFAASVHAAMATWNRVAGREVMR